MEAATTASSPQLLTGRLAEEDGAQAVEYAMIGGLGAGLIGLLWTVIERTGLVDKVVQALLTALVDLISGWF